jgi:hypothetical protein
MVTSLGFTPRQEPSDYDVHLSALDVSIRLPCGNRHVETEVPTPGALSSFSYDIKVSRFLLGPLRSFDLSVNLKISIKPLGIALVLFVHSSAVSFVTPPTLRRVFTGLAWTSCPSRSDCSVCLAFRRLSFGESRFTEPPDPIARADPQ